MTLFDEFRERFDRLVADRTPADPAGRRTLMREALVEARVAVASMREALGRAEAELAQERRQLDDAERRGGLAERIGDAETVEVARHFAGRHRERIAVLERKVAVQQEELRLAERDVEEMTAQLRAMPGEAAAASAERAWRDLGSAGGTRPELDVEGELLRAREARAAREAAADAQLAELKRRMGRE